MRRRLTGASGRRISFGRLSSLATSSFQMMRAGARIGIRKGNLSPDLVGRDVERREPKVEVAASRREAAPWSHTSTPNRRWQNRECCQRVPIRGRAAVIFRHCCQRGIQRESPSNLTNGQETGKIFQRKMFHVLTVFFRLVLRFLLDPSLGQLVLVPALRSEVAALIL